MSSKNIVFLLFVLLIAGLLPLSAQNAPASQPVLDVTFMDKAVDPCVDFYTYSCGGWMKNNPIPPDQSSWGVYGKLQDENLAQLRGILEDAVKANAAKGTNLQKIGDYYATCTDLAAIDKIGAAPLVWEFMRIAALKSKSEIAEYLATGPFPDSALFDFSSGQDFKDSTQVIAQADQGGLGLPDRD